MRPWIAAALAAVVLCASVRPARGFEQYTVHDLGSLGGLRGSGVVSLNGVGTSVGYSFVAGTNYVHAMTNIYGAVADLGTLGGSQSLARAVNSQGWVVGWAFDADNLFPEAFLWRDGGMQGLGDLGYPRSDARAINDAGLVVGSAFVTAQVEHAFWWQDGVMTDAGTLGGSVSRAYDVNSHGVMCGMSGLETPLANVHPFIAKMGERLIDLGTLGGEAAHAFAINDLDHAVGWSYLSPTAPESRAFLYHGGVLQQLADLGGPSAAAFNLDNNDVVVGDATYPDERQVAVIWKGTAIADLNQLVVDGKGWVLTRAWDIDEAGVIVGEGLLNGEARGFLLAPAQSTSVPEPPRPSALGFAGAHPNPVRSDCRFAWTMPQAGPLRLEVFDVRGRRVRVLAEQSVGAGAGSVSWDARDDAHLPVGSGIYWARLSALGTTLTRRVVVTR